MTTIGGFDVAADVRPVLPCIVHAGYKWIGRYLCTHSQFPTKKLTAPEAQAISAAGLSIVSVWENGYPENAAYFTPASGTGDGTAALELAQAIGQPKGSAIYFAVDYDAGATDLAAAIEPYFEAVAAVVGGPYKVGVYGSGLVCRWLAKVGLVAYQWRAGSREWSGYDSVPNAAIAQSLQTRVCGLLVDPDAATGDFGEWSLPKAVA